MFEQATAPEPRTVLTDWLVRGVIAAAFIGFGIDKFPSAAGTTWVTLFQEIGLGQWFRYFTGIVEIAGGLMVLAPKTATAGLALLAATMASAALLLIFVVHRPTNSMVSLAFFIGLSLLWLNRRTG